MKIALINKYSSRGGASIACKRLLDALNENHVDARMVVQEYSGDQKTIVATTRSKVKRVINFCRFVWERLIFLPQEASKDIRFAFSLANTGEDISQIQQLQEADIIHLHWFNQGYLSLKSLRKIFQLDKPIVWTMHDMWAFTGGCHYAGDCVNYLKRCGSCYYLKRPHPEDLSHRLHIKKEKLYKDVPMVLVGCSNWMAEKARRSSLFSNHSIVAIPNPIDTKLFLSKDKMKARKALKLPPDKKIILFGAANSLDKRKGIDYLLGALDILIIKFPQLANELHCAVFGKAKDPISVPIDATYFSYMHSTEQLVELYSASDVFVLPSLDDNLPNTVMEALSCSVPVVAFNTGGLPEMVDHLKNGFLASPRNTDELTKGIMYILFASDYSMLQQNARKKVTENYNPDLVASKYIDLYTSLLKKQHGRR